MNASFTRRGLLAGVAAAIAAAGAVGFPSVLYAQANITLDEFVALSERLTQTHDLDRGVARTLLGGFLVTGNGAALAQLANRRDEDGPVANAIVAAWYSGIYQTGNGMAVASLDRALLWNVLTFTKPPAFCGGETGYWANPPEA